MSKGRLLQGRVGFMRIEALKYQTDKKEGGHHYFVDYNEVYSEGYHVQWSIADIALPRPPSRNYIFERYIPGRQ